jgi:hypothetical protein
VIAESAHGSVASLGRAEGGDLAILDEIVVQSQDQVAVGRRPVVGIGMDDKDVAVQAEFPGCNPPGCEGDTSQAWVREPEAVGELPQPPDRRLGLMRAAVLAILQPQPCQWTAVSRSPWFSTWTTISVQTVTAARRHHAAPSPKSRPLVVRWKQIGGNVSPPTTRSLESRRVSPVGLPR